VYSANSILDHLEPHLIRRCGVVQAKAHLAKLRPHAEKVAREMPNRITASLEAARAMSDRQREIESMPTSLTSIASSSKDIFADLDGATKGVVASTNLEAAASQGTLTVGEVDAALESTNMHSWQRIAVKMQLVRAGKLKMAMS
jgi:hypothetical protein